MISRDYNSHSLSKEFLAKHALTFYPTVTCIDSRLSQFLCFLPKTAIYLLHIKSEKGPFTTSLKRYSFSCVMDTWPTAEADKFYKVPS